ncbi:MAG TPA: zinc ABC transporter substrate-binding protein, partial [Actinomycetota bacterium]|nr:zinc ABC transporter substrate-binding protein [Actinomycetota bacterium]
MAVAARRFAILACLLTLAGCSQPAADDPDRSRGKLQIAATVAPITNIVSNIVGDLAGVTGIVPEGTNSHTFEPSPDVAELLSTADLIFLNGLMLEEPTRKLAEVNKKDGAEIVQLGTLTIEEDDYL